MILSLSLAMALNGPLNVRDYGATGDGVTVDTQAIQRAMDEASSSGRGVVRVPAGRYLCGSLHLRSHVNLALDKGATILGSTHRHDYDHGVWYGLLMAEKVEDIQVTGRGTIDGQGAELAKDVLHMVDTGEIKIPPKGWRPSEVERPELLEITACKKVRIEGVTLKDGCCWIQTYRNCRGLTIQGIKVDSKTYWNNDGIDVVDCRNVRIADCDIDAADDGICLKSDDPKLACENVTIRNCKVRSSASAIKFGTSSHGGFRHIKVDRIQIRDTFRSCVALESVDGGTLEDVIVSNIHAVHTGNAFFIRLGHRTLSARPGRVRHVVLKDFDVQIPAGRPDMGYPFKGPQFSEPHNLCPSSIVGLPLAPIEDVRLERIKIRFAGGGTPVIAHISPTSLSKIPDRPREYPEFTMFGELPSWALFSRHVRGLVIKDFSATLDAADYRPAVVVDDVNDLVATRVRIAGADRHPTLVVRSVRGQRVDGNCSVVTVK